MRRIVVTLVAWLLCFPTTSAAQTLYLGTATSDITPPPGYRMSGYFRERLNEGTHDPLLAKVMVLVQGRTRFAWVFCDFIGVSLDAARRTRQQASEATGIPARHILIAATHSHTGPLYFGALRNHFRKLAIERHGKDPHEDADYTKWMVGRIVKAVKLAQDKKQAVVLSAGTAQEDSLSFNRRFHMRNGAVRFNPGRRNPDIVRPAGPIDPEVGLLLFSDTRKKPSASLAVFALHLDTVGGAAYSADYPFHLQHKLHSALGADFLSVFAAGTCGDINHIDVAHSSKLKGQAEAQRIGRTLGETVIQAIPKLPEKQSPSLGVKTEWLTMDLQHYSTAEVAAAAKDMHKIGSRELSFLDQVRAYKITALQERGGQQMAALIQAFRLSSDTALVGLPGEVFVELGLEIKQRSPFANTLVVELSGDAPGYIPTRKAFAEGSYETVNSRVRSGEGERMVKTAVKLLKQLQP